MPRMSAQASRHSFFLLESLHEYLLATNDINALDGSIDTLAVQVVALASGRR